MSDACAADTACAATYPDLAARLTASLEALDTNPAPIEVTDPSTGEAVPIEIDAATAATVLFSLFYTPTGPATAPYLINTMDSGDLSAFGGLPAPTGPIAISQGMQLSFLCAEEVVDAEPSELETGDLGAGRLLVDSNPVVGSLLWELCEVWDVEPANPDTFDPISTHVPLLVVTGQYDQITPPSYGQEVADAASTAWYVEVPGVGHAPLTSAGECGVALLVAFVEDPTTEPAPDCELSGPGFYSPDEIAALEAEAAATTTTTAVPTTTAG